MKNLTLVIPAKDEADALPKVLEEIKTIGCEVIVVLESKDIETIKSIKNYNCKIIYQIFLLLLRILIFHFFFD